MQSVAMNGVLKLFSHHKHIVLRFVFVLALKTRPSFGVRSVLMRNAPYHALICPILDQSPIAAIYPSSVPTTRGGWCMRRLFVHAPTFQHAPKALAIDGTHIPVTAPFDGYRDYVNRKGWTSIILQAVCDDKCIRVLITYLRQCSKTC